MSKDKKPEAMVIEGVPLDEHAGTMGPDDPRYSWKLRVKKGRKAQFLFDNGKYTGLSIIRCWLKYKSEDGNIEHQKRGYSVFNWLLTKSKAALDMETAKLLAVDWWEETKSTRPRLIQGYSTNEPEKDTHN